MCIDVAFRKGQQQNSATSLTQSNTTSSYLGDKHRNRYEIANLTIN